jgi:hypothetical protein
LTILLTGAQSAGPADSDSQPSGVVTSTSSGPRGTIGRATAQFGVLRAFGQAIDGAVFPPTSAFGRGTAQWNDDVTIAAPGLSGQTGTVTVRYRIDGNQAVAGTARARVNYAFQVALGATILHNSSAEHEMTSTGVLAPFLNTPLSATFPIVFGSQREWRFAIDASGTVLGISANSSGLTDLGGTAVWLGITEVRDGAGNVVADYSVQSGSGTDWSQAIPEPSASLLVLLAAVLLGVGARPGRNPGALRRSDEPEPLA